MPLTKKDVFQWLDENTDPRGVKHWKSLGSALRCHGIGLTKLRKYAKEIGKDSKLAAELWNTNVYDAKILGLLIDDPKAMSPEQANAIVESGLDDGHLSHVFTTCGAPLAKASFAGELCQEWMDSADETKRRCGYGLLYELSKRKRMPISEDACLDRIELIRTSIHSQPMWVREAMNTALLGLGKRNQRFYQASLKAAEDIGPVNIDYGQNNSCEPLDVLKHLSADHLREKFAH